MIDEELPHLNIARCEVRRGPMGMGRIVTVSIGKIGSPEKVYYIFEENEAREFGLGLVDCAEFIRRKNADG